MQASEEQFERLLRERLCSLTKTDEWLGQPADARVTYDPEDPLFARNELWREDEEGELFAIVMADVQRLAEEALP